TMPCCVKLIGLTSRPVSHCGPQRSVGAERLSARILLIAPGVPYHVTTAGRSILACLAVLVISAGTSGVSSALAASGGAWSPAASMRQPHQAATATLLPNGKVLVVGG